MRPGPPHCSRSPLPSRSRLSCSCRCAGNLSSSFQFGYLPLEPCPILRRRLRLRLTRHLRILPFSLHNVPSKPTKPMRPGVLPPHTETAPCRFSSSTILRVVRPAAFNSRMRDRMPCSAGSGSGCIPSPPCGIRRGPYQPPLALLWRVASRVRSPMASRSLSGSRQQKHAQPVHFKIQCTKYGTG